MRERIQWETGFFGLLAAVGLAALLLAMLLGGLVAVGTTDTSETAADQVDHVAAAGGAIALAILALAYLTGGYVAGRMGRFAGWKQGLAVWLLSALVVAVVAITAWIAGGDLNPTQSISLPADPVDQGPLTTGSVLVLVSGAIALGASLAGGVLGERFHRALDHDGIGATAAEAQPDEDEEPTSALPAGAVTQP